MKNVYKNFAQLVGHTPLFEPQRYNASNKLKSTLLVKLEAYNPTGSAKDRIALAMIEEAENSGELKKDAVIIEPTSGNTGIGLAAVAAAKGYRAIMTMPDTMSEERRTLIKAYGAEIVLTPGKDGMKGSVAKAEELAAEYPHSFLPGQFSNPVNPAIHRATTGPEIYQDTDGKIDIFLASVGTGGTLSGTGEYLKSQNPNIKVIAIEPSDSPLLSKGKAGPHKLQGLGANFIPTTLNKKIYDEIITASTEQAYSTARKFASLEGILLGISSGATLYAATQVALRPENAGKVIVALSTDSGNRYLSTDNFLVE